jgi:hypothetical protein
VRTDVRTYESSGAKRKHHLFKFTHWQAEACLPQCHVLHYDDISNPKTSRSVSAMVSAAKFSTFHLEMDGGAPTLDNSEK